MNEEQERNPAESSGEDPPHTAWQPPASSEPPPEPAAQEPPAAPSSETASQEPVGAPSAESPSPEPVATSTAPAAQQPPPAAHSGGPRLPGWIVYVALAVVPAVIVGAAVYFLLGDSEDDGVSPGLMDGFVRLTVSDGQEIQSFVGELPEGFPSEFPAPTGGKLSTSYVIPSPEGTTYIVAYETSAPLETVYNDYLQRLDEDPFQLDLSRSGEDFTGMQFSRPDSADFQGSVTITTSEIDGTTGVFVFVLDISQTAADDGEFELPASRALPPGFPDDVPLYAGQAPSIVMDTYFQRDPGVNSFLISFITRDADVDVINFYTKEFQDRGWTVTDGETEAGDFALVIDFEDGPRQDLTGSIRAEAFADDPAFTEVTMIVQVSATRGRGN